MNNKTNKSRQRIPAVLALAAMTLASTFVACDSYNNGTGSGLMPDYVNGDYSSYTLPLTFNTISASVNEPGTTTAGISYNNIYVNSSYGYIGSIPNTVYGNTSCEYLTQFYLPSGFKFGEQPINNRIDSAFIVLSYSEYTGRGIDPLQISAYKLKRSLPFVKNSISDVSPYVDTTDPASLLGQTTYTAAKGSDPSSSNKFVKIPISRELGQEFYDLSKDNSPVFANQESFNQFFPGVYIKTTAGQGSILRVKRTSLALYYSFEETLVRPSTGKKDSLVIKPHAQLLSHTMEVPQVSRFANQGLDKLIGSNSGYSYVKSPAGVFTEITIPTVQIAKLLKEAPAGYVRELNSVPMVINATTETSNDYSLMTPPDLILMPTDSVASFFKKELTESDAPYSTYVSTRTSTDSKTYSFGNIVQLVKQHIKNNPDRDLKVTIIPILRSQQTQSSNSNYSSSSTPIAISNLILPSALMISTGDENNKVNIIITQNKAGAPF